VIDESTERFDALLRSGARKLTGYQRRLFQAEVATELCGGSARQAERRFGWGRDTVETGLNELRHGMRCRENFAARGRRRSEEKDPPLAADIRAIVEPHTHADPELKSARRYTNLSVAEVRAALINNGYGAEQLPRERTMRDILNKTGINWEDLPVEMGCGSGTTCWRRLRDWAAAGVWAKLHEVLLAELEGAGQIDWSRAIIDSSFVRARGGGGATGPSPVDRRKNGSKHQVITDAHGVPLPWPRRRRRRTSPMWCRWWSWSMRSRRCAASRAGRAVGRRPCSATEATIRTRIATSCAGAAFDPGSPGGRRRTAAGWGSIAGTWSERCRGCTVLEGCASARIEPRLSIRRFSDLVAQ
jgi:transposase